MSDIIQGLWIGDRLSSMESAVISSYLRHGHAFHLYTYGPVENVPVGVEMLSAARIVERRDIDRFQNLANFSDFFRYALLFKNGGWWVDLDAYCLRAFDFSEPYVFSTQLVEARTGDEINSGVIKMPKAAPMMQWCLDQVAQIDTKTCEWSAIGPALMVKGSERFQLQRYAKNHTVFCPLHYFEAPANVMGPSSGAVTFGRNTYSVHLWNEEWRRAGRDKDASYPGSLYDKLRSAE